MAQYLLREECKAGRATRQSSSTKRSTWRDWYPAMGLTDFCQFNNTLWMNNAWNQWNWQRMHGVKSCARNQCMHRHKTRVVPVSVCAFCAQDFECNETKMTVHRHSTQETFLHKLACSEPPNGTNISVQNISKMSVDMVHFSMEFFLCTLGVFHSWYQNQVLYGMRVWEWKNIVPRRLFYAPCKPNNC